MSWEQGKKKKMKQKETSQKESLSRKLFQVFTVYLLYLANKTKCAMSASLLAGQPHFNYSGIQVGY